MTSLLAALSPDASRIAALVPTPGTSLRVQILATRTAALQSTLLHRRKDPPASDETGLPRKILFISDSLVAVYCPDLVVVWDLHRGVVASTVVPPSEQVFGDAVACDGHLYVSVWSNESKKAQIHRYKPEKGKVEQKIKAGSKGIILALRVDGTTAVVRLPSGLRMVDVTNGHKVAKYSSIKTESNQLAFAGDIVVTVDSGEAILVHRTKGKLIGSIPMEHAEDELDMWSHAKDDVYYLRIGSKVYSVSRDGTERTLKCQIEADVSVDRRVILGRVKTLYALLQKSNQFQSCQATVDQDTAEIQWKEPESKEKVAAKRKEAAVLGPTQTGGEAVAMTDGPATKKQKKQETEDTEMKDADEEEDGEEATEKDDQGPSIAERLANLRNAIDDEDDDDDEGDDEGDEDETSHASEGKKKNKLPSVNLKKITTESLTELLEQALQSSDKSMLEQVLPTSDDRKLQATCERLSDEHLLVLLRELTARLASTPGRAPQLCAWFKAVLKTGRIRSIEHLQPLSNILEERLAVFPALLKLEGRLTAMIHQ